MFAVLSIKCYLLLIRSVCWKDNEKVLQPLFLTVLAVPSFVLQQKQLQPLKRQRLTKYLQQKAQLRLKL